MKFLTLLFIVLLATLHAPAQSSADSSRPHPEYSAEAKSKRITGAVMVKIVVDEQGEVIEARPMCGRTDVLANVSRAAATKARFTPSLKDGKPIKVTGHITYNFMLAM